MPANAPKSSNRGGQIGDSEDDGEKLRLVRSVVDDFAKSGIDLAQKPFRYVTALASRRVADTVTDLYVTRCNPNAAIAILLDMGYPQDDVVIPPPVEYLLPSGTRVHIDTEPLDTRDFPTPELRKAVLERFGFCCAKCGCPDDSLLVIDHHWPFIRGGRLNARNAVALCKSCNSKKLARDPREFYTPEELQRVEGVLNV